MTTTLQPPIAPRRPHRTTMHGEAREDPYFWLRERDDPAVIAYLEAENAYTEGAMAGTRDLQEALYAELRGHIKETDETVPAPRGGYLYFRRTEEGKQYPIYLRRRGPDAPEELLLDQNALAEGLPYCRLGAFAVSPDGGLLAYSVDASGAEQYALRVKDLGTGEHLPDEIPNTTYGVEWANDNRTLLYSTLDEARRPYKLFRHTLGADPAQDELVHHEEDDAYYLMVSKTRSEAYLLLTFWSNTTTEVRYAPADEPSAPFAVIRPRERGVEYRVEHHPAHGGRFIITTNADGATNFKVMQTPADAPGKEQWRDLIPHRPDVLIDGMDAFAEHLAIYERREGLQQVRISGPAGEEPRYVQFREPVYTVHPGPNEEFDTRTLRFTYSSLVTPNSVIDYGTADGAWEERKRDEIPSGYDPALYRSERVTATAPDGAQVPISLVYPKDIARDGSTPLLLYGYGAYGYSYDPDFSADRLSLLERGFAVGIAHIRGGSELGREWYERGKLLHKRNTFSDFIACAEHLVAEGYTAPDRLAISGASAGGLLMGAVVNARPDLFAAVVTQVPFVDAINTMSDPTLPLTVIEYEEWGNPAEEEYYRYMRGYSPYDNVAATAYPAMLVLGGLNDPRVAYWEPAKWVARLRATKTDDRPLLLRTKMEAGHGGPSGRYERLREVAFEYAFLLEVLGLRE